MRKILLSLAALGLVAGGLTACANDSDVVSKNLSTDADNYKIWRQIVVYNAITDKYILEVDGYCSLGNADPAGEVTYSCKVADGNDTNSYIKDIIHTSDNTFVFAHQIGGVHESPDHYKVTLKPETIIPEVDFR